MWWMLACTRIRRAGDGEGMGMGMRGGGAGGVLGGSRRGREGGSNELAPALKRRTLEIPPRNLCELFFSSRAG